MSSYTLPEKERSVLLTIDTQNDFSLPGSVAEIKGTWEVIPQMQKILEEYRKLNLPIIHIVRLYKEDGSNVDLCRRELIESGKRITIPDSEGSELVSEIRPSPSVKLDANLLFANQPQKIGEKEWILYKSRWGAFFKTPLEDFLKQLNVNTIVVIGCNFPNCPRTTIYEASERDFKVIFVPDAISQIYEKGILELENIGVYPMNTSSVIEWLHK